MGNGHRDMYQVKKQSSKTQRYATFEERNEAMTLL